jgi:hypothetical protein
MDLRAHRMQLLNNEAPARRRLQRHLERLAGKALDEPAHVAAQRGRDPRPAELAGVGVDPLGRDLGTVLIESHYDRHHGASSTSTVHYLRASCAPELRRSHMRRDHRPAHAIFGRGGAVRATSPALSQCARDAVAAVSRSFSAEVIVVGARDGIGNDAAYP